MTNKSTTDAAFSLENYSLLEDPLSKRDELNERIRLIYENLVYSV